MAEPVVLWRVTAADITLTRVNTALAALLRLDIGRARIMLGSGDAGRQAEAMRKLARLAGEAADELERRAAERKAPARWLRS